MSQGLFNIPEANKCLESGVTVPKRAAERALAESVDRLEEAMRLLHVAVDRLIARQALVVPPSDESQQSQSPTP